MKAFDDAMQGYADEIAEVSARIGRRVDVDVRRVVDRSDELALARPGVWSPNRSCRMVRAADGWIAVNLPREDDRRAVPAWIGCRLDADMWPAILRHSSGRHWRHLVEGARLLGLPVSGVGEVAAQGADGLVRMAEGGRRPRVGPPRVLDLSSLWAGPLCGAILAEAGLTVTKMESRGRPDVMRAAAPAMFERLNGAKRQVQVDFADAVGAAERDAAFADADVVITSARPRAFEQMGLTPQRMFAAKPGLVWVAISGHGWTGPEADRVAFGDDAAAAGGLVRWSPGGAPRFAGDALADPLTGLFAALGALRALERGGGVLVDAAMAQVAARAAAT